MLIRCSSLAKIMTEPKTKAEGVLSKGAKTYLTGLAKEVVYGYREEISSKAMEKGTRCEQDSIDLYNSVLFESLTKNTERRSNDCITGEPDLIKEGLYGVDIKTSWSLPTFPALPEDVSDYEWQARGYMCLFDLPRWDIAFCMVDTPDDLIGYESHVIHKVSEIDPQLRVTAVSYLRDPEKESRMLEKARAAQLYIAETIERIKTIHGA